MMAKYVESKYSIINYTDCSQGQLKEIFDLRNHPDMRKWASNPVELTWDNHLCFVDKLKGDKNRLYFAVYLESKLIGSYNLHHVEDTTWERGLFSSPEMQGKRLTPEWESQILRSLPRDRFKKIVAEVKINNPKSIRYHEKMGFVETGRDEKFIYYKKEI